jgi:hypothetical protein
VTVLDTFLFVRGLTAHIMAFNGSIPGPIVVVYQYDYVELTPVNLIVH